MNSMETEGQSETHSTGVDAPKSGSEVGIRLRESALVHHIVADPRDPPDTLLLTGFIGRSTDDSHTRIYLDVLLSSFVDIRTTSIIHAQEMSPAESPLGGSYVWVKRDQDLVQRVREAREEMLETQEDYLGDLQGNGHGSLADVAPGWPTIPADSAQSAPAWPTIPTDD